MNLHSCIINLLIINIQRETWFGIAYKIRVGEALLCECSTHLT